MKILAISQVYWPDTASVAQHLSDLLEALISRNHIVSIITSRNNYENPDIRYLKTDIKNGVKIHRINNTSFGKKNKLLRLIDFITFNILVLLKLIYIPRKSVDAIIGLTSPPLLSYLGNRVCRNKGIKFIYWTMDLQPELSIVAGYFRKNGMIANFLQKKGDYIFKHADLIITLDKYMKKHIINRTGRESGIIVVPVWPVMNKIFKGARENNLFRNENEFGNKIIIMYSGNHSVMHPLNTILELAHIFKNDPRFLFVHVGGGVRIKDVMEYKSNFNLNNVRLLPYQPREKIHLSLGAADIQVVLMGNDCVGLTHPNKIYGAMFIAKPILYIGPTPSHITDILSKCPGNIMAHHGDVETLRKNLNDFAKKSLNDIISIGERNMHFAKRYYSPQILKKTMADSIELIDTCIKN